MVCLLEIIMLILKGLKIFMIAYVNCQNKSSHNWRLWFSRKSFKLLSFKGVKLLKLLDILIRYLRKNDYWLDYSEKDFLNILSDHKFDAVFYLSGNPYPAYSENNLLMILNKQYYQQ